MAGVGGDVNKCIISVNNIKPHAIIFLCFFLILDSNIAVAVDLDLSEDNLVQLKTCMCKY